MERTQLDIKYRPVLESGEEYRIETRDGKQARIICWDKMCSTPIVALIKDGDMETICVFCEDGTLSGDGSNSVFDLFIVADKDRLDTELDYVNSHLKYWGRKLNIKGFHSKLKGDFKNEFNKIKQVFGLDCGGFATGAQMKFAEAFAMHWTAWGAKNADRINVQTTDEYLNNRENE